MIVEFKNINHKIIIDNDLLWLEPYLKAAQKLIPIIRLIEVKGYEVSSDKMEQQQASCTNCGKGKYRINLIKWYQDYKTKRKGIFEVAGYTKCDCRERYEQTLTCLAHELAHLVYWKHNANRFVLETKLLYVFAKIAQKLGYKGF